MSKETNEESDILQVEGINSKGFGLAPKLVMLDDRLSIFSKGIYCYFSSYAGAGKIAFPKVTKIIADLKISKNTYYAHFNPLVTFGFIKVEQTRISGKHSHNVYTLMDLIPKSTNLENKPFSPCTSRWDTVKRDTIIRDTIKCDTNNNSLLKNNRSKSNILEKHPPTPQTGDAGGVGGKGNEQNTGKTSNPELPEKERVQPGENLKLKTGGGEDQTASSHSTTLAEQPLNSPQTGEAGAGDGKGNEQNAGKTSNPELSEKERVQPGENLKLKTGGGEDNRASSHSTTLVEQQFEKFWEAYLRKAGKMAALKAWKRLNPDAELCSRIMMSVAVAINSEQWQRENGRYIPNPLTWINQGRWDDVFPAQATPVQQPQQGGTALSRLMAKIEAAETARDNEIWGDGQ